MEADSESVDWWSSPQTKRFVEETRAQALTAFQKLEKACRETSDAAVRGAFVEWKTTVALAESMSKRIPRAS